MGNQFWWESDDFFSFLRWMANAKDGFSDSHRIIDVVQNPTKFRSEWIEYNEDILQGEEVAV